MSILDININEIQSKNLRLYNQIKKIETEDQDQTISSIENIDTKEEYNSLIVDIENKKYRMNSKYYPNKEAEIWADQFVYKNIAIVVSMFGFGNGIFVRKILDRLPKDGKLIIFEPSKDIFMYVMKHYDLSDIWDDSRVLIFIGEQNRHNFNKHLSANTHWSNIKSQIVCLHPQFDKIFMEKYRDFLIAVNENNERTLINRNTESYFAKSIAENAIINLPCIKKANTVPQFIGKLDKEIPAIIVSAGPSLDLNIDELKRAKGKAVIVATDTALRHLFAHDIDPDFVVTIDPRKPADYFSNPRCKEIPMFCKVESNREILQNHTGRKIICNSHPYINKIFRNFGKSISVYHAGGSVATAAFSICAELKFKRIVLIGQDLAYGDGVTHAGGEISSILAEEEGIRMVEDTHGNMIKSRYDWYLYLKWFENSIVDVPNIEVIDATEGGAKIKGTTIMTLKEVIDEYCNKNVNCKEIVNSVNTSFSEEEIEQLKILFNENSLEFSKIINKCNKAIELCTKIIKEYKNKRLKTQVNTDKTEQLSKINRYIEKTFVYDLIESYMADEASKKLENIYQVNDNEKESEVLIYSKAKEIYQTIKQASIDIKPMFDKVIENFD